MASGIPDRQESPFSSEEQQCLIPGLPDDLAMNCIIRLPPSPAQSSAISLPSHFQHVCRRWRRLARSQEFSLARKDAGLSEEWLCAFTLEFVQRKRLASHQELSRAVNLRQLVTVKVGGIVQDLPICFDKNWWPGSDSRVVLRVLSTRRRAWTEVPLPEDIAMCREFRTAVVGCPRRLFVIGGFIGREASAAVWIYDPASNTWSRGSRMAVSRARFACGVMRSKEGEEMIVAAGGSNRGGGNVFGRQAKWTAEVYNPRSDTWRPLPTLPQAHPDAQGVIVGGRFHVLDVCGRATVLCSENGSWAKIRRDRYPLGVAPPLWPQVEVGGVQWALDRTELHRVKICRQVEPSQQDSSTGSCKSEWVVPPVDIYVPLPVGVVLGHEMPFQLVDLGGKPVIVSADLKATLIQWKGGERSEGREQRDNGGACRVLSHGLQQLAYHGQNTRLVAVAALEV